MLLSYRFKNFQSFTDWTEVDFTLKAQAPKRGWERMTQDGKRRVSTTIAIFGANASGKTALIKPLAFLHWLVSESFANPPNAELPLPARLLDPDNPTEIEVEIEDSDGVIWKYEVALTDERVIREVLYRKQIKFAYVFKRTWIPKDNNYEIVQQGFGFAHSEAKKVRPNTSLIATAAQYGVELALKFSALSMYYNVNLRGRSHFSHDNLTWAATFFHEEEHLRDVAISLMRRWDMGIDNITLKEIEEVDFQTAQRTKRRVADVTHRRSNGTHFVLPMVYESSGTQASFLLLSMILPALEQGGLAVIDEMESDIHPDLVEPIMALFDNPVTNPNCAQLLFTSHTTKVLEYLGKSQVIFVEKRDSISTAFKADQVQGLRADDNLRSKYETGSLGAVPEVT